MSVIFVSKYGCLEIIWNYKTQNLNLFCVALLCCFSVSLSISAFEPQRISNFNPLLVNLCWDHWRSFSVFWGIKHSTSENGSETKGNQSIEEAAKACSKIVVQCNYSFTSERISFINYPLLNWKTNIILFVRRHPLGELVNLLQTDCLNWRSVGISNMDGCKLKLMFEISWIFRRFSCVLFISRLYQTLFIQGLAAEVAKSLSRRKSRRVNYRDLYKIGKPYVKTIRKKIGKS